MFVLVVQDIRVTKRLLITLRHPGPAQSIISVLPSLTKTYETVAVVATDTALLLLQERYSQYLNDVILYYCEKGIWSMIPKNCPQFLPVTGDCLEFKSQYEKGYQSLIVNLSDLLKQYQPDIVLRTTPATKWGVDEALAEACRCARIECTYRCYQEYYNCGMNLESFPYVIATIDEHAQALLKQKGIESTVIGWLNQAVFNGYRSYKEARKQTRKQLGLTQNDMAVLYCTVDSGDLDAELKHYSLFLKAFTNFCTYIRFHPRNQEQERQQYIALTNNKECVCVDNLSMDGVLAFPDVMVSAASAINLDMLQYQAMYQISPLQGVSVFTKGIWTEAIILAATGQKSLPTTKHCMGSLIIDENSYEGFFNYLTKQKKLWLYDCVKKTFGVSNNKNTKLFLDYLDGTHCVDTTTLIIP
jgi:hypothetical protein